MLANQIKLFIFQLVPLFLFLGLLIFTLVASNTIIVGHFESLKLRDFLAIQVIDSLCQIMEEPENLTEVLPVDHRSEVVDLLVAKEKVKKVFHLL